MSFPPKVKEDALVACGRCCCLCHRFCGLKIEIHHIKPRASGGPDTFENAIPLCFDCHADMRTYDPKHPKGTKYSENELTRFRNDWFEKIKNSGGFQSTSSIETDKLIFQKLMEVLPWNGSLSFISTNNFAGWSFRIDNLDQLSRFQYLCDNPAFEFIDTDLESSKAQLLNYINRFQSLIGQYTFPTSNPGFNHIPPEWEEKAPQKFNQVVSELENTAKIICNSYQELTRTGTRKLGMLPNFAHF